MWRCNEKTTVSSDKKDWYETRGNKFPTRVPKKQKVGIIPADKVAARNCRVRQFLRNFSRCVCLNWAGSLSPFKGPGAGSPRHRMWRTWGNSREIPVNPDERRCVRTSPTSFCIFQCGQSSRQLPADFCRFQRGTRRDYHGSMGQRESWCYWCCRLDRYYRDIIP